MGQRQHGLSRIGSTAIHQGPAMAIDCFIPSCRCVTSSAVPLCTTRTRLDQSHCQNIVILYIKIAEAQPPHTQQRQVQAYVAIVEGI